MMVIFQIIALFFGAILLIPIAAFLYAIVKHMLKKE